MRHGQEAYQHSSFGLHGLFPMKISYLDPSKSPPMKPLLFILCLLIYSSYQAQTIFSVDAAYKADVEIFVVDAAYKADLLVFKVDAAYKAKENEGLWFFTDAAYKAKKTIFFTDAAYKAELLIYFVDAAYKAKWQKVEKKHLMY
jgi:hypothetical protein